MKNDSVTTLLGGAIDYEAANYDRISAYEYKGTVVEVTKQFDFEAGHYVPDHPERCKYVHGHSYKLFVTLSGPINKDGMVVDFHELNNIVSEFIDKLDHSFLNDIYELPTAEIMAADLFQRIETKMVHFKGVHCEEVKLYETSKCCATVRRRVNYNE